MDSPKGCALPAGLRQLRGLFRNTTALITGRYQDRLSVGLDEPLAGRNIGLPPDVPTLPSLLKKAGYGTTLVGKWHLGLLPKYGPLQSGYDHFYGFRSGASDYYTHPGPTTTMCLSTRWATSPNCSAATR